MRTARRGDMRRADGRLRHSTREFAFGKAAPAAQGFFAAHDGREERRLTRRRQHSCAQARLRLEGQRRDERPTDYWSPTDNAAETRLDARLWKRHVGILLGWFTPQTRQIPKRTSERITSENLAPGVPSFHIKQIARRQLTLLRKSSIAVHNDPPRSGFQL